MINIELNNTGKYIRIESGNFTVGKVYRETQVAGRTEISCFNINLEDGSIICIESPSYFVFDDEGWNRKIEEDREQFIKSVSRYKWYDNFVRSLTGN